jgi:SM-20-related protein
MALNITLNPTLDRRALADAYRRDGMIQIPEFFAPETAEALGRILEGDVPWERALFGAEEHPVYLSQAQVQAMGLPALQAQTNALLDRAGSSYGFMYDTFRLITAWLNKQLPGHPIHELTEFLNGPQFLDFGRAITGDETIIKADGQATRYRPGDFIGLHNDDTQHGVERVAAYTLGFTRRWRSDWGGQLAFHDNRGDISRALVPRWNTLTLFQVPRLHSVVPVSLYAQQPRVSVVGWLRKDR